jgi:hypothetical protein
MAALAPPRRKHGDAILSTGGFLLHLDLKTMESFTPRGLLNRQGFNFALC